MNPNQFGQQMGMQMPNVPSPQEMWKDEKVKYRPWLILLAVGLTVIIFLNLAGLIVFLTKDLDTYKEVIQAAKDEGDYDRSVNYYVGMEIATKVGIILAVLAGTLFYIKSIITSYQKKSFSHLSTAGPWIIGFGAFIAFFTILTMLWSGATYNFNSASGILAFITNIVFITMYLVVSRKVVMIKRSFMISERVAALKANPMFSQMMGGQPAGNPNPYGPPTGNPNARPMQQSTGGVVTPQAGAVQSPVNPELAKLEKMSVADLKKVAGKLSISGNESMEKPELINAIMKVTSGK